MTEKRVLRGMEEVMFALRMAIAIAGSQGIYAKKVGVSKPFLSMVLKGIKAPGPKILADLKFQKVEKIGYEKIQDVA